MMKFIVVAISIIFAASAFGAPKQIELIGLIPGVSTEDQVKEVGTNEFIIGGYGLQCITEYIDGLLSDLSCYTGEEFKSRDTTSSDRIVSNTEVHNALVKGFTKKFGKPSRIDNTTVTNGFGTKFNNNQTRWIDQKGNALTLMSIFGEINSGLLMLESRQEIKKSKAEEIAAEQNRKF